MLANIFESNGDVKRVNKLRNCSKNLYFDVLENNYELLKSPSFCRDPLCYICRNRRYAKNFAIFYNSVLNLIAQGKCDFLYFSLTVRNCERKDLPETLNKLNGGFTRLQNTKEVRKAVKGYCKIVEITSNTDPGSEAFCTLHPHMEGVFVVNKSC